mmetsp:Transcript_12310/g.29046  ORF Transcript_12310/g.29046 Transcript_12310/m.29046 type:complete len:275 (+) Transcript_12310:61-885(+)
MTVFIAGAITSGFIGSHARTTLESRLSLNPSAILARVCAEQGATRRQSAQRRSSMCTTVSFLTFSYPSHSSVSVSTSTPSSTILFHAAALYPSLIASICSPHAVTSTFTCVPVPRASSSSATISGTFTVATLPVAATMTLGGPSSGASNWLFAYVIFPCCVCADGAPFLCLPEIHLLAHCAAYCRARPPRRAPPAIVSRTRASAVLLTSQTAHPTAIPPTNAAMVPKVRRKCHRDANFSGSCKLERSAAQLSPSDKERKKKGRAFVSGLSEEGG